MKNKKGFTLVELLATIAVIAIIASIATVSLIGVIKKSKEDTKTISEAQFKKALELYIIQNKDELINKLSDGNTTGVIYEDELVDAGYMSGKVTDEEGAKDTIYSWKYNVSENSITLSNEGIIATSTYYLKDKIKESNYIKEIEDNDGTSYYYYSKNADNYLKVSYNGVETMFRIIRINGDGTIRLLYNNDDNGIQDFDSFNALYTEVYHRYRENDTFEKIGVISKFCKRIFDETPTYASIDSLKCPADSVISNEYGLMTLEEAILSNGDTTLASDQSYISKCTTSQSTNRCNRMFLYSRKNQNNDSTYMYITNNPNNGYINYRNINDVSSTVRPVININKNSIVTNNGNGTATYPYELVIR